MCHNKHPKNCVTLLLPPYPQPLNRSPSRQNRRDESAAVSNWGDTEVGGGRGNPSTKRPGHSVASQRSSSHRLHHPLGSLCLASCRKVLHDVEIVVLSRGDEALQLHVGPLCWQILPSCLAPTTVQLWDPRLLRLQGCDSRPGHRGLREYRWCSFVLN